MKRVISLVLVALMAVAVFAGCGGNNATKEADLNKVLDTINSENGLSLEKIADANKLNLYYSVAEADVKQFAAEIDSNNNAPVEIIMIEATDANAATEIETALAARYNSIISQYGSYTPDKLDMVKACSVTKDGNYVTLIIADNAPAMVTTFQNSIK